ncbi:MAG: MBOAT family protein [Lachnospiraceae bacterium]|nr:MBOAT family protein [Lachnospiraceae bacterium]
MLFSSITFLYFFLPCAVLFYFMVPQKGRNFILFVMSLLFYAWGEPVYVLLMLMQIVISFVLVLLMDRFREERAGRAFYMLSVLLPFAALFYFKYFHFFMENLFGIRIKTAALPIGISFYTFQIASYCIDVWHGRVKRQENFITYAAYVTLFPQLVAGPIVRYSEIEQTLVKGMDSSELYGSLEQGIVRFAAGLGKKVLIANVIGEFAAEVLALEQRGIALSWAYAIAVSLQIYFDFSGYSDMAIGLGNIFGFHFPENFRYPFISKSISEFWRRWHITLGAWFRDYVYIPLGGNRVRMIRWIFNIFAVWFLTGLWHGAGWNFILWGLMFAVLLVMEKGCSRLSAGADISFPRYIAGFFRHLYVAAVIIISFLIFQNDTLTGAFADIQALAGCGSRIGHAAVKPEMDAYLLRNRIGILCIGLIGSTPVPLWLWQRAQERLNGIRFGAAAVRLLRVLFTAVLLLLCTAYLIDGSFNPFLYFRF